jgi:uncharacterized protein YjiS (DUF1127 family)
MPQTATAVSNFVIFSQVQRFIKDVIHSIKISSEIRSTYRELNRLSDAELRDIGINRSDIASIAMEPYYNSRKAR